MSTIKHSFEDLIYSNINFTWKKLIPPLSQAEKKVFHTVESSSQKPVLLIVFDGVVQVDFGLDLDSMEQSEYKLLNKFDLILLTGDQHVTLLARSAWIAQILTIQITLSEPLTVVDNLVCQRDELAPVGSIGLWRTLPQTIQEVLGLDLVRLLIGPSNSWLGANYHLFNDYFRLIEFQLPVGRSLPEFQNENRLILAGLSGSLKINSHSESCSNFSDWINSGSIAILQPGQDYWQISNQGETEARFLLFILSHTDKGLLDLVKIKLSIWDQLVETQGTIWSRICWPMLHGIGLRFE